MMHILTALSYTTNVPPGMLGHGANMHLPLAGGGGVDRDTGLTDVQFDHPVLGAVVQVDTMLANWQTLTVEADLDRQQTMLSDDQRTTIGNRINYAGRVATIAHYDTVLYDLLYYMQAQAIAGTRSYAYARAMLIEANARRIGPVAPVIAIPRAPLPPPAPPQQTFWQWIRSQLVMLAPY